MVMFPKRVLGVSLSTDSIPIPRGTELTYSLQFFNCQEIFHMHNMHIISPYLSPSSKKGRHSIHYPSISVEFLRKSFPVTFYSTFTSIDLSFHLTLYFRFFIWMNLCLSFKTLKHRWSPASEPNVLSLNYWIPTGSPLGILLCIL